MSFKMVVNIGYFNRESETLLSRAIDFAEARTALQESGGVLVENSNNDQKGRIAALMAKHSGCKVIGFIEQEYVVVRRGGYLALTIGFGPQRKMHRFLTAMCDKLGCGLWSESFEPLESDRLLAQLAQQFNGEPR